ncbi:NupC/NupG family nucleoside CNT transporter [Marilutibacter alkalisoli]|uniref:NupC/NupG family nucleoside CNT transporter n=1 Tax=Marilutibacter alkalisoli TaxID=2591633 RepID=A0A514BPF1_9GAMM|nr:nucleoside transporter C-terminal domain-containing protein [Lysobacter alkalisoli]QDH69267.1 NupC/NupG family nucleoside CNT transporter [Lysobacter alkalisoli]
METLTRIGFGLFGLAVLLAIAWVFSANRRAINWRLIAIGLGLQLLIAGFVLLTPWGAHVFDALSTGFVKLLGFTTQGARFIFGDFTDPDKFGFVFAFQVLPTIIFFASFMSVLYHLGVMQKIVQGMAWVITKLMPVSGAETLSVCANAFIGQTESPLVVKPYISKMTESELLTLMVGGMATIAGGVLGAYVMLLGGGDTAQQAFYAKHLITASIMAAPATLIIAKILVPETNTPLTLGTVRMDVEKTTTNVIDAAAAGASDGLRLALNVGAMLLAFIALIAVLNGAIGFVWASHFTIPVGYSDGQWNFYHFPSWQDGWAAMTGHRIDLSLQTLLGTILSPLAWAIGVPWQDANTIGGLIGTKVVLNEFVAYVQLGDIIRGNVEGVTLTDQGRLIATYALCGFANFSSIAIQIGGIGGIAPDRRHDLARFGLRAVLGGSIATLMTATIAGVLTHFA